MFVRELEVPMHHNWPSVRRFGLLSVTWTVAGNSLGLGDDTWAVYVAPKGIHLIALGWND